MLLEGFYFSSKITVSVSHTIVTELHIVHLTLQELQLALFILVLLLYLIQMLHQFSILPQLLVSTPHHVTLFFQLSV